MTDLDDRLIAIEREGLARIPAVVAVAVGRYEAIQGALQAGWIHTLVTDEATARWLLQMEDEKAG